MEIIGYCICALALLYLIHLYINSFQLPDFFYYSAEVQACKNGYSLDKHFVTTPDNYILQLFRLSKTTPAGPPVLLVHGILGTAESFMINNNAKGPAYRLVDEGFDVWLLNTRGSGYSRNHTTFNANSPEFWNWTVADISNFDLPSSIDYIKQYTKTERIGYMGMSQGAIVMLLRLAIEKRDDIAVMISIAGSGRLPQMKNRSVQAAYSTYLLNFLEYIGINKILDKSSEYATKIAMATPIMYYLKRNMFDYKIHGDNKNSLGYYTFRIDGGVSIASFKYYCEAIRRGNFFVPDYGRTLNLVAYNSPTPPQVDMKNIQNKIALFGGIYDTVISPEAIEDFYNSLEKENVVYYDLTHRNDHGGFLMSGNQSYIDDVVRLLRMHLQ